MLFAFLLLPLAAATMPQQVVLGVRSPTVLTPTSWRSIGPFPIGTRESAILPPIDLSPDQVYRSPLVDGGIVSWTSVESNGRVLVNDSSIRWELIRSSSGWVGLQHEIHYVTTIEPKHAALYAFDLIGAHHFTLRPLRPKSNPESFAGNIYKYIPSSPHLIPLDAVSYEIIVTYTHDIRVAGEPTNDKSIPTGEWSLDIVERMVRGVEVVQGGEVVPDIVGGMLMGDIAGVRVRNLGNAAVWVTSVMGDSQVRLSPSKDVFR